MSNQTASSLGIPPPDGHPPSGNLLDAIDKVDEVIRLTEESLRLKKLLRRSLALILVKRGVLPRVGLAYSRCPLCGKVTGKRPDLHKCEALDKL